MIVYGLILSIIIFLILGQAILESINDRNYDKDENGVINIIIIFEIAIGIQVIFNVIQLIK